MPTQLTGSAQAVAIGDGYAVRSPGIQGTADLRRPRDAATRSRGRVAEDGTEALEQALAAASITEVRQVELQLKPVTGGGATRSLRGTDEREVFELLMPDLGAEAGQLVLACDESGVLTWHLPVDEAQKVQVPGSRGAGGQKRFLIPAAQPQAPTPDRASGRTILRAVGRKLLKCLVYPVTDPILGPISEHFAERWEGQHRPYGLRLFTPADFRQPGGAPLTRSDWDHLTGGRILLFIHGTFSTAPAAFQLIPDDVFKALHDRYEGRVLAFNHFTLSHDPQRNIQWLLTQLPVDRALEVDIICHSRGGLVARTLAERPSAFHLDTAQVNIGRVVFVAVPNHGTPLADPDHMVKMIDRLTTLLNLFPTGFVAETLEALVTAVKLIGHGALKGLPGLAAMQPDGAFLHALNQGAPAGVEYYAIAADFEPVDQGLKALVAGSVADAVLDRVFEKVPNDLVVPEPGVYGDNGCLAFPIPDARLLEVPNDAGVVHTNIFGYGPATTQLSNWLA